jgi:hypothetical protein
VSCALVMREGEVYCAAVVSYTSWSHESKTSLINHHASASIVCDTKLVTILWDDLCMYY